jgi:hypothetical protein
VYARLRSEIPELPNHSDLPPLNTKDVITALQMLAPFQVLGKFSQQAKLNHEIILAVTDGDTTNEIRAVNSFIEAVCDNATSLVGAPTTTEFSLIEFHLDGPGFPAWHNFVRFNNQIGISLEPFGVLVPDSAA